MASSSKNDFKIPNLGTKAPMSAGVQAVLVQSLQGVLDALTAENVVNANRRRAVRIELARAKKGEW